jgi:hypothetical protein
MKPIVRTLPLAFVIGAAALSLGQEAPTPVPAPVAPPAAAASPPAQAAPQPGKPVGEDEEFIPSEELSADEAVTFPVDI